MDKFDASASLLISAIVGSGVFALPLLASRVGLLSSVIIFVSFLYMLGLGYLIIEMTPGTVEEEVERNFGRPAMYFLKALEILIIILALVSYVIGLKAHLGVNEFVVFAFLLIPLVMELHFPASFTKFLAFFTLGFISILTLGTITAMEIPTSIVPESGLVLKNLLLLFFGSCFAFFGHNIIPRVRMILRDKAQTKKVFYTAISIVFLLYLPFAVSVAGTGVTGIATKHLAEFFSGPLGALIEISAVIIFYTSFVIFGLHTLGEFGFNLKGLALMLSMVVAAYYITMMFGMDFPSVICLAGFLVTLYTGITAATAIKSGTEVKFAYYLLGLTILMWAGLVSFLFA